MRKKIINISSMKWLPTKYSLQSYAYRCQSLSICPKYEVYAINKNCKKSATFG